MDEDVVPSRVSDQTNDALSLRAERQSRRSRMARVAVFTIALLATLIPLGVGKIQSGILVTSVDEYLILNGYYAMSVSELKEIVRLNHLDVYWVGPVENAKYSLDTSEIGRISVRYLFDGQEVNETGPQSLIVSTYKDTDAFRNITQAGKETDAVSFSTTDGDAVLYFQRTPNNVYVAFKGKPMQVELYDWRPGMALDLALGDGLVPVL